MVKGAPTVQIPKSGCPHGLPPSACPICSGKGGGGGASTSKPKVKEMSWSECFAVGQQMKAEKLQRQEHQKAVDNALFASRIADIQAATQAEKFALSVILTNLPIIKGIRALAEVLPAPIQKIIKIMTKPFNVIISTVENIAEKVREKMADISDKLVAIFGEQKNAISRFFEDKFGKKKKSSFNPFGLVDTEMEQGEEEEKEDEKFISKFKKGILNFFLNDEGLSNEPS